MMVIGNNGDSTPVAKIAVVSAEQSAVYARIFAKVAINLPMFNR